MEDVPPELNGVFDKIRAMDDAAESGSLDSSHYRAVDFAVADVLQQLSPIYRVCRSKRQGTTGEETKGGDPPRVQVDPASSKKFQQLLAQHEGPLRNLVTDEETLGILTGLFPTLQGDELSEMLTAIEAVRGEVKVQGLARQEFAAASGEGQGRVQHVRPGPRQKDQAAQGRLQPVREQPMVLHRQTSQTPDYSGLPLQEGSPFGSFGKREPFQHGRRLDEMEGVGEPSWAPHRAQEGRSSHSSSSGRDESGSRGSRERTGRNIISGRSARDHAGKFSTNASSHERVSGKDTFGGVGLFIGPPAGGSEKGAGGGDTTNIGQAVGPGRTRKTAARRTVLGAPAAEVDQAYFFTDEYPFTAAQLDREKEGLLGHQTVLDPTMVQMDPVSRKMLLMTSDEARDLEKWDIECARKHLDAIKDSVTTHDDLHEFTLMDGERVLNVLDLAGLEEAPGVFDEVTQGCRVVFTNKKRLVFTQAKHSADVGLSKRHCLASLLTCWHDRWSHRTWHAYFATINASEVLQVFVQQKLTTSYQTSTCTCNDILDSLCCSTGGTMHSEKNIDGVTQTLGDHDPGGCVRRWDKTRYLRHALVIRYVDCASNSVRETTAMALPSIPASQLFEMARSIEANITIRTANWMNFKTVPTALNARSFNNSPPPPPLFKRESYKWLMFLLLIVALIFFAVNTTAAVFMLLAVLAALFGAYSGSKEQQNRVRSAGWWIFSTASKTTLGSNGLGLGVYAFFFLRGIPVTDYL